MNLKRYIDMAVRREIRRSFLDGGYLYLNSISGEPAPEQLRGKRFPNTRAGLEKLMKIAKKIAGMGRCEIISHDPKYGTSRDFYHTSDF